MPYAGGYIGVARCRQGGPPDRKFPGPLGGGLSLSCAVRIHLYSEVVVSMYMYVYIKEGPGIGRGPPHAPGALRTVPRCAFVAPIPSSPPVPVGNATSSPNSDPKPTLS